LIIKSFKLSLREDTGEIVLNLTREYPDSYSSTDEYVIEKYELDLNDDWVRSELNNAIKSQTVLQFMSDELMMSSSFFMVPINNYTSMEQIRRPANLRMAPIFLDITSFIETQNTSYIDTTVKPGFLYLYRIVYSYNDKVYNTEYVAGFEKIESSRFISETTGRRLYKPYISNDTMLRLFGPNWANLKQYFNTELSETRVKYRQDPKVYKLPFQRVNLRFKGPNELYKLLVPFREMDKSYRLQGDIQDKIAAEALRNRNLMTDLSRKARGLYAPAGKQLAQLELIVTDLAGSDFLAILLKTENISRILSFDTASNVQMVPNAIKANGIYIVLKSSSTATEVYHQLLTSGFNLIDTIYILVAGEEEPIYKIEYNYG
jgi:hypothetical protein